MKYNGKIIALAFPDTYVKGSTELICKLLPYVGLGTKEYIKAGHAALILVENKTRTIQYFDFGRYVTPPGQGRVRSALTDIELTIDFKAQLDANNNLLNLDEILLWLEANPQKTHGSGRLLASVCDTVNYKKALKYLLQLQERGSIPYGVFEKDGSNCSRLVTETLLASTQEKRIIKKLNFNKLFTPSTVGNVEIGSTDRVVYEVYNGKIGIFKGSAFKENLTNYFDRKNIPIASCATKEVIVPEGLHTLEGTGSTAYFEIVPAVLPDYHFRIKRYNELLEVDYDGVFYSEQFNIKDKYEFTYDSHCKYCHVIQNGEKIRLDTVGLYTVFNSMQKVHSA